MKQIVSKIYYLFILGCLALSSCTNEENVTPDVSRFVRIDNTTINLNVGEEYIVRASVDTLDGKSYQLQWSVADAGIASIEGTGSTQSLLKALTPGKTTIKVETQDHKLKYYADLNVSQQTPAIRLLTIGSGRADDSNTDMLTKIASATNKPLVICNIFTDNGSLKDHLANIKNEKAVYTYKRIAQDGTINNQTEKKIRDIVNQENWDFIAIEESTDSAGIAYGYNRYLSDIVNKLRSWGTNPKLKILLHEPWAYAKTTSATGFATYEKNQLKMFNAIATATEAAKDKVDKVVPVGTAIQNGRTSYWAEEVLRDDINLNMNTGRYIAALTWYATLFDMDVSTLSYLHPSLSAYDNKLAKTAAQAAVTNMQVVTELTDFKDKGPNEFILKCPIYIDFGTLESPAPFNNYKHSKAAPLVNLLDSAGNSTYFGLAVTSRFTLPDKGLVRPTLTNTLGFPSTACTDMFFCDSKKGFPKGTFKLSYLNKDLKYSFYFYGSINDTNTGTKYRVIGKNEGEAELVTDNNTNKMAIIQGISPKDDGTIDIELSIGSMNTQWAGFICINAMIITPDGYCLR